jgi:hypothetical protein
MKHEEAQKNMSEQVQVFISSRESVCSECGENLGRHAMITLNKEKGVVCLSCADMDHLVFLPAGDAALTRRAGKYSTLSAVVLKWSQSRKRYERQGLLVEEPALQRAEQECLADEDARARRRERESERRAELDREYVSSFAQQVRLLFPRCPAGREVAIAEHACQKYSGRVGRSAQAKKLDDTFVMLAVVAHIRHTETNYDQLLAQGVERSLAREQVRSQIDRVLADWKRK